MGLLDQRPHRPGFGVQVWRWASYMRLKAMQLLPTEKQTGSAGYRAWPCSFQVGVAAAA